MRRATGIDGGEGVAAPAAGATAATTSSWTVAAVSTLQHDAVGEIGSMSRRSSSAGARVDKRVVGRDQVEVDVGERLQGAARRAGDAGGASGSPVRTS